MSKKTKNVHILKTDEPSRLHITGKLSLYPNGILVKSQGLCKNQHVYITVDDTIKIGDREIIDNECRKLKFTKETRIGKKVILSTDPKLVKDGVQEIPNHFLEFLVQNPSCESVKIDLVSANEFGSEITVGGYGFDKFKYKITLPKEETKLILCGYPDKHYNCKECGEPCGLEGHFIEKKEEPKQDLEKEMFELEQELGIPLSLRWHNSKPKQENNFFESLQKYFKETPREKVLEDWAKSTEFNNVSSGGESIEEAAERLYPRPFPNKFSNMNQEAYKEREAFISGANFQQEQDNNKYSKDDLREAFRQGHKSARMGSYNDITEQEDYNKWLKQFKKK